MSDVLTKDEYKWFCNSFSEYYFIAPNDLKKLCNSLIERGMTEESIDILYEHISEDDDEDVN